MICTTAFSRNILHKDLKIKHAPRKEGGKEQKKTQTNKDIYQSKKREQKFSKISAVTPIIKYRTLE